MNKLLIDSSAWVEYFEGTHKGDRVRNILAKSATFPLTTGMIATEVLTRFLRFDKPTELIATALRTTALLVPFDIALAQKTAEIYVQERKRKPKFGVADAHVLAAARVNGARILTCDNDFAGIPEAMIIR